ncbi:MAG: hypothetical protein K9N35_02555 [Candidatus Marinimicrobia bacterium]|nr:hypothetical protein [Candidatus Neomarinimicrobiota bacterium]
MKQGKILLFSLLALSFAIEYCSDPIQNTVAIEIKGTVLNDLTSTPIASVVVRLFSPDSNKVTQTDASGDFLFTLGVDTTMDLQLIFNKEGFISDTIAALGVPERNVDLSNIYLLPIGSTPGDTTSTTVTGTTGPSTIALKSVSSSVITVLGSGGTDNTSIIFQVQDSTGLSVGSDIEVSFTFGSQPNGGEYLSPLSALTDEYGKASVNLVSGTKSGVVQIIASVNVDGALIRSQAIPITIHGGLPDQAHFGLASEMVNFPALGFWGRTNAISAYVGDKYGNFCTPGTAIYFKTDGGMIDGSGLTENGSCSVQLVAAPPKPEHETLGKGFATITAMTANDSNDSIETSIVVLFSGGAIISDVSPTTFSIPDGGSQDFSFTIADENGNPLSEGTTVKVSFSGSSISVSGGDVVSETGAKLPDTQSPGPNITDFSFTVYDESATTTESPLLITISSNGLNGPAAYTISGSVF